MADGVTVGEIFEPTGIVAHELLTAGEAQYAAQTYLGLGWAVTAGPGLDEEGVCWCLGRKKAANKACRNPGKHAYKGWGNDFRRTLTYEQASKYWDAGNKHWIGRPVDQVFIVPYLSGLVVADVDQMAVWMTLSEEHRPETLYQSSGSGRGGHYLYKYSWDLTRAVPPSLPGRLPKKCGEVKFRGIIAGAPSAHRLGGRYKWMNWGTSVAEAPKCLTERDKTFGGSGADWDSIVESRPGDNQWIDLMYASECRGYDSAAGATTGRPVVIFAVAASMAKWVASGYTTEDEVVEKLLEAGEANGALDQYGSTELERQIRNGLETGRNERRVDL